MKARCVRFSWALLLAISLAGARAADTNVYPALKDSVVMIIRHAEKPPTGDDLNADGYKRASAYPGFFATNVLDGHLLKIDSLFAAADSKSSRRSRLTIEPLGAALKLKVDTRFANKQFQDLVEELRAKDHGREILIAWHHGQIPNLIQALGADPAKLLPQSKWPDEVFGWMIILRYDHEGRLIADSARRLNQQLMPDDKE